MSPRPLRTRVKADPLDLAGIDDMLSAEEKAVRAAVRQVCASSIDPYVAEWFESGDLPGIRDLARELGKLGLLGMHLEGYGCAGMSAVDYGLACLELEASDSGIRSLVSVQGSLAMFAIWEHGTVEQKQEWLPAMAAGEAIGCFGLTEPDHGSDPAKMRTRARRDGDGDIADWILTGSKMWITNGSVADVAIIWAQTDDGIRGFVVPTDTPGFSATLIKHKMSLRASITSELVLDGVGLPHDAVFPEVRGLIGPLSCLNEARYGILWGAMGAARSSFQAALEYAVSESSSVGRSVGSSSPRASWRAWPSTSPPVHCWPCTSGVARTAWGFVLNRSASESSTTSPRRWRSVAPLEPSWVPTESPWSIP